MRYAAVSAGLALLVATFLLGIWPLPYEWTVEKVYLPSYEEEFGFHGGRIRSAGSESSAYGITYVVPGGRLARAGVKAGDIPVEHHGGMMSFYYALKLAAGGEEAWFKVVSNPRDFYSDREPARKIRLAPK